MDKSRIDAYKSICIYIHYIYMDTSTSTDQTESPPAIENTDIVPAARHHVYLLKSTLGNYTYVGYSTDPVHRLRQHNGILTGGASATHNHRPWETILIIAGIPTHAAGLSMEWYVKNQHKCGTILPGYSRTRYTGARRLLHVRQILDYYHRTYPWDLHVYCESQYHHFLTPCPYPLSDIVTFPMWHTRNDPHKKPRKKCARVDSILETSADAPLHIGVGGNITEI